MEIRLFYLRPFPSSLKYTAGKEELRNNSMSQYMSQYSMSQTGKLRRPHPLLYSLQLRSQKNTSTFLYAFIKETAKNPVRQDSRGNHKISQDDYVLHLNRISLVDMCFFSPLIITYGQTADTIDFNLIPTQLR